MQNKNIFKIMVILVYTFWSGVAYSGDSRFTDNGNQTITDSSTKLIWTKAVKKGMSWANAVTYLNQLNVNGVTGWRLPTEAELLQLYSNRGTQSPADYLISNGFQVSYGWTWTGTEDVPGNAAGKARAINLGDLSAALRSKTQYNYTVIGVK